MYISTLVPPLPSKLVRQAKKWHTFHLSMGLLTHLFGKLFRRQSSMANTVDSKLIGIPEAIRLEFLVNFYGTTPNTKHILAGSGHFQTTTWDLWNPVVNTENFNNQPPSTGEWKPDFWTSAHLEVSIALSYSPQRGESCSPVFRQRFEARFGIGYAHAPQVTTSLTRKMFDLQIINSPWGKTKQATHVSINI